MAKELKNISWEADETIARDHNIWWYVGLFAVGAAFSAFAIIFQVWSFLALIILSVIALLISSLKPPRRIKYTIDQDGLTEGTRLHNFDDFKAFGILKEDSHFSVVLLPKKRFGLSVKVYFPEDKGEAIVDNLGSRLPMEEIKPDILDKIVNWLRI